MRGSTRDICDVAIGVDIGGTKIAAGVVDGEGGVQEHRMVVTPAADGPEALLTATADLVAPLQARHPGAPVGVGTPGTVDVATGTVTYASAILPGWTGTAVGPRLGALLGVPVDVDNDVNVAALAETEAVVGTSLFVTVGTSVGGALLRDGRVDHGCSGTVGELAHLLVELDGQRGRACACGRAGHLEGYVSGPALLGRYRGMVGEMVGKAVGHGGAAVETLEEVAARAADGDSLADGVVVEGATALGRALGGLCNVLDPAQVVVGGGVPEIGDRWWGPFVAALRGECLPGPREAVQVRRARLGAAAGVVGAARLARQTTAARSAAAPA